MPSCHRAEQGWLNLFNLHTFGNLLSRHQDLHLLRVHSVCTPAVHRYFCLGAVQASFLSIAAVLSSSVIPGLSCRLVPDGSYGVGGVSIGSLVV